MAGARCIMPRTSRLRQRSFLCLFPCALRQRR